MSSFEIAVRIIAGLALIAGNALFVLSEFSLTRLRQFSQERVEEVSGTLAWEMTDKLEIYLTACQLGISLTSITLGIVSEPAVTASIRPVAEMIGLEGGALTAVSFGISLLLINLTQKIWGEQAPTYLGVERPLEVARVFAPVLYWWTKATYPLVIAGDTLAKWTLRIGGVKITRSWTVEEGEGNGEDDGRRDPRTRLIDTVAKLRLPPDRRDEIVASYEIGEMPVREIATPPDEIVVLDAGRPWADNAEILANQTKTRLPLVRGSLDDVVGFVYLPALFSRLEDLRADAASLEELASPPLWVDAEVDVAAFVDILQQEKQELALIRDDGELIGLATATDAFEAITGELEDPLDVAERDEDR